MLARHVYLLDLFYLTLISDHIDYVIHIEFLRSFYEVNLYEVNLRSQYLLSWVRNRDIGLLRCCFVYWLLTLFFYVCSQVLLDVLIEYSTLEIVQYSGGIPLAQWRDTIHYCGKFSVLWRKQQHCGDDTQSAFGFSHNVKYSPQYWTQPTALVVSLHNTEYPQIYTDGILHRNFWP